MEEDKYDEEVGLRMMEEVYPKVLKYLKEAPESPVKLLIKQLCQCIAYSQKGIKEAQAMLQDLECDRRYWNVRVRVKAEKNKNLLVYTEEYDDAEAFWDHLYSNGYEDPEPCDDEDPPGFLRLLEDDDDEDCL